MQVWSLFESADFTTDQSRRKGQSLLKLKIPPQLEDLEKLHDLKAMFFNLPDFKYLK